MNKVIKNIKIFLLWILGIVMALIILGALIFAVATENDKRNLKESRERAVIREETERKAKAEREAMEAARTLYDPDLCKTDAGGMVYYAAGNHVFRFPYQSDKPLYSRKNTPYESPVTIPIADETELEGCPNNPLRGGGVPYYGTHHKHSDGQWQDYTGKVTNSSFWSTSIRGARPLLIDFSHRRKERLEEIIDHETCKEIVNGFENCFGNDPDSIEPGFSIGAYFKVSPEVRGGDADSTLYLHTQSVPNPSKPRAFKLVAEYSLYESILITLNVVTEIENSFLMIEHEKRARKYIENAHYRSYNKKSTK